MSLDPDDIGHRLAERLSAVRLVKKRADDPWLLGPCLTFGKEIVADLMRAQQADPALGRCKSFDERADELVETGVRIPLRSTAASHDLAQMAAVLAAEGYAWVHPLDGSPKRLEKVARPADDARAILEGAARGRVTTTLMGEAGPEALEPLIGELRALRLDMDALREAEQRRGAAARDAADVLDAAARGASPEGAPTRGEGGE